MGSASRPYEYLAMFASAVGWGYMDSEDADSVLSSWWTGLTGADIDLANETIATGTSNDVTLWQEVAESMFGVQHGLDINDAVGRQIALDWLESLRERLPS